MEDTRSDPKPETEPPKPTRVTKKMAAVIALVTVVVSGAVILIVFAVKSSSKGGSTAMSPTNQTLFEGYLAAGGSPDDDPMFISQYIAWDYDTNKWNVRKELKHQSVDGTWEPTDALPLYNTKQDKSVSTSWCVVDPRVPNSTVKMAKCGGNQWCVQGVCTDKNSVRKGMPWWLTAIFVVLIILALVYAWYSIGNSLHHLHRVQWWKKMLDSQSPDDMAFVTLIKIRMQSLPIHGAANVADFAWRTWRTLPHAKLKKLVMFAPRSFGQNAGFYALSENEEKMFEHRKGL
jgi:hypothetical protein